MSAPGLSDFRGRWRLTRQIKDFRAGQDATFAGEAVFSSGDVGLLYTETGLLQMGAAELTATRRYLWRDGDGQIDVFFEDGRPFHSIATGTAATEAAHFCDPDQYDVRYDFGLWPQWQSVWRVRGPRKDYEMTSTYQRYAEEGSA